MLLERRRSQKLAEDATLDCESMKCLHDKRIHKQKGKTQDRQGGTYVQRISDKGFISIIYKDSYYQSVRRNPPEKGTKPYEMDISREKYKSAKSIGRYDQFHEYLGNTI